MMYFKKEKIPYREKLVEDCILELNHIAAECSSKEEFAQRSLSFVNGLFDKINIEAKEYYRICKLRAVMLARIKWVNDGEKE